ncbi:hypothetical protein HUE87_11180 [Candidatus Sulfurimonas marisnigri]|uniref:DUF1104 domain-containing protein n=1 Tax=Candidatus Sulfurimonas marisnigri TaxID=2740405 RepID=A0A7S7M1B3_9BACT|nr:hypothetical protein [Candidatus Sulfurimonas marisnigri]QOY54424.1 hypothetical protein HUE87_11180 [Candidatus Sulfurimonas marisnigri]
MKTLTLGATLMLLGTFTLGMSATIDEQISAIETATTTQERVRLVNEFKTTLSTMSAQERAVAIDQLRSTMQTDGEQVQTRTQTRERSRLNQMDETQLMQQNQIRNQNQVGSQYMQQNAGGSSKFMNKR